MISEDNIYEIRVREGEDDGSFWCDILFRVGSSRRVVFAERVVGRTRLEAHLKASTVIKSTIGGSDWLGRLHLTE